MPDVINEDIRVQRDFKPGFQAVCYIGTMPRLVQTETWFFGIIHCSKSRDIDDQRIDLSMERHNIRIAATVEHM